MKTILVVIAALGLAACASAPRPLQGQYANLYPNAAASQSSIGSAVRWGGRIVAVEPQSQRSCFEIVAMPLSSTGRPYDIDRSEGRFIACRAGFYDPEVFQAGREITISGRIDGFETRKVGDYDYRYPMVAADVVYLWTERRERDFRDRPILYSPYGPWW